MLAFLSQHFLALLVTCAVMILIALQAWQYHVRSLKKLKVSYEKIMNNMLDGFVIQKDDGTVVGFNTAAYKILGVSEHELLGQTLTDPRWQAVRDDGSAIPMAEHPSQVTLTTGQILQNVTIGLTCPNGDRRWIAMNSVPLFEKDQANPSHVVATFQDVTSSRRLAEEAQKVKQSLDLALKIGGIGIWVLNVRTGEVYRDDQIFAIYGIKRESFPNDFQSWTQLVHPDDRKRVVSDLESAIKSGQDLDFMFKVIRPDGTLRHLRAIAQIVRDGAGRTTSVTGVNWDITDQVEREVRLQEAKDKAEQASRAKSDFLANMSHEIRTPLNGVFGMLSLLKDSDLSKIQLEMLQTIETCSEGLLTVLNDVLDLSRIESRRIQMEQVPFDIHQCSQDVIKLMLPQATHKKLPLHFDGDAVKSRVVVGDAARFKQVLMNLISNAIKFTEQGEVRLCMHGHELDPQHFHFVIEVKDTGIGISQDNQKKLFKAFSQADSTISRRFGGTGLGLTISASLVELMGGQLEMESHPGKGSIFRLQLPLSLAQAAPIHALHGKSESLHAMIDASQRILIVEDNKINQIVVTTLLNKMGFVDVDVAEDGLMALQQLELKHYDLIFMDMQMPGMDGLTATRRIREDMKKRPLMIIAMTANAFDEDRRKCLEAGMDDFLAKPFNRHDLERILLRLTERKAS